MQYRWGDFSLDPEDSLSTRQGQQIDVARGTMRHRAFYWQARFTAAGVDELNKDLRALVGHPRRIQGGTKHGWRFCGSLIEKHRRIECFNGPATTTRRTGILMWLSLFSQHHD